MDFQRPRLDFKALDRRYTHLKQLHEAGNITDKDFAKQLKRLMVKDQKGRWWSKSPASGEWHYHNGQTWVQGTPPGVQPTPQFSKETSSKPAVETAKEVEQASTVLKNPQERPAYFGDFQRPSAEEQRRREEEWQAEEAQQAKALRPTLPEGTKRPSLTRGMLLSWLLIGLGVTVLAVGVILGIWSTTRQSATPPPSPSSNIIVKDDFSNTSSGWPRNKDNYGGSSDYDTSKGIYNIAPASGKSHYASVSKAGNIEDANVEVDATRSANTPKFAHWGVVCRQSLNSNNDANNYSLAIQNDGMPAIWKVKDGVPSLISDPKTSTRVKDTSATNHIRGDCVGDKLTLYVNDQKLAEASDNEFTRGEVGLYAGSPDSSGTDVSFDSFSASEP